MREPAAIIFAECCDVVLIVLELDCTPLILNAQFVDLIPECLCLSLYCCTPCSSDYRKLIRPV